MAKVLTSIVVVVLLAVGGYFLYQNFQTKYTPRSTSIPQTIPTPVSTHQSTSSSTVTSDPCEVLTKGSADVPPLYSGVQWQQPKMTEEEIIEYENYNQLSKKLNGCLIQASNVESKIAEAFDDPYYKRFESSEWKEVFSADGPDGSIRTYKKQNQYILIEKRVDAKISSPNNIRYNLRLFYTQ